MMRLPKDDVGSLKQVAVNTIYKILFIYMCCAFVCLDNKLICVNVTNLDHQPNDTTFST
jgi:hypothetical protein